jgi:hypothetical protein
VIFTIFSLNSGDQNPPLSHHKFHQFVFADIHLFELPSLGFPQMQEFQPSDEWTRNQEPLSRAGIITSLTSPKLEEFRNYM